MARSILEPWEISQDRLGMLDRIKNHLSQHPIYNEGHHLHCLERDGNVYIGYQTGTSNWDRGNYFDVQITGDTFYLLHIELEEANRGKNHGLLLYQILEQLAKDLGCKRLEMTPSGTTIHGELRQDYLTRKLQYRKDGNVAVKEL